MAFTSFTARAASLETHEYTTMPNEQRIKHVILCLLGYGFLALPFARAMPGEDPLSFAQIA